MFLNCFEKNNNSSCMKREIIDLVDCICERFALRIRLVVKVLDCAEINLNAI